MKKLLIFLLLLSASGLFAQHELDQIALAEQKGFSARQIAPAIQAINNSNFIYQRCEWNADPAVQFISGKVTTYFIPDNSISMMEFDLSDSLIADSVIYHQSAISFTHLPGDILQINFPSSIPGNITDSVSVFYHGVPANPGFGSFSISTHGTNNTPVLWTLSEPYGAKDWWPCKQNLYDKIDSIDIIVTSPNQYRAASNGLLADETVNGNFRTCTWKHRHPIAAYLVCFAVSDYVVYSDFVPFAGDTVEVLNYVYPEDSLLAAGSTPSVIGQMQLFDTLFGAYPFTNEKYGHTECNFGGGMEHQTMTFLGGFSYELLSHELAHHWFGDKVTCGNWHDIWLNEGFASYLSGICYEHFSPTLYWPIFKAGRIGYITSLPDGSVYCADTTNISRIFDSRLSYAKGAMVLHSLRWVIGDSAFFAAIRNYLNDPAHAYGFASTADLKQHFETSSGQNLTWFFDDWFYGEGHPSYSISWSQDANNLVTFIVGQTQSHSSVSFFEMPLELKFKNSSQDTSIRINHTFVGESFSVQLPFAADSLLFDPEYWIISANNTVNGVRSVSLNYSISLYPNPAGEELFLKAGNGISGNAQYTIYDAQGKRVMQNGIIFSGNNEQKIFTGGLNSGLYLVVVETENGVWWKRFVKE